MIIKYKGVTIKDTDINHVGRAMARLDGVEVFSDNNTLLVVQDNRVIDRDSEHSKYEYFTLYAHNRRNEWEEL